MMIQIELSAETEARLAAQAAARSMDVPAYAATLLERAAHPVHDSQYRTPPPMQQRPAGRKSLPGLFADSPFRGLDLDFERDPDIGREVAL